MNEERELEIANYLDLIGTGQRDGGLAQGSSEVPMAKGLPQTRRFDPLLLLCTRRCVEEMSSCCLTALPEFPEKTETSLAGLCHVS
jgi:hypothetical protein